MSHGKDPVAPGGEVVVLLLHAGRVERQAAARSIGHGAAERDNRFGGAFDRNQGLFPLPVPDGGIPPLGLEGYPGNKRRILADLGGVQPQFAGESKERHIDGIAPVHPLPFARPLQGSLVVDGRGPGQMLHPGTGGTGRRDAVLADNLPFARIPRPGDREDLAGGQGNGPGGLLVHREGAGLVARDQGAAPEALHRGEISDDDVSPGHARRRNRERDGERDREALRDRRDREGDGKEENLERGHPLAEDDDRKHTGRGKDGDADLSREVFHPDGDRRLARLRRRDRPCDLPDLGILAGCNHEPRRPAAHDGAAGIEHVSAVGQGKGGVDCTGALLDRVRLAGQERLVDGERLRPRNADIGGNAVAGLQDDAVAGNQVFRRDGRLAIAPPHPCPDPEYLL